LYRDKIKIEKIKRRNEIKTKSTILKKELMSDLPQKAKVFKVNFDKMNFMGNNLLRIANRRFSFLLAKISDNPKFIWGMNYGLELDPNGSLCLINKKNFRGEIDKEKLTPFNMNENDFLEKCKKIFNKYHIDSTGYKLAGGVFIDKPANEEHTLGYSVMGLFRKPVAKGIKMTGPGNSILVKFGADGNLWELTFPIKDYELIDEYNLTPPNKVFKEIQKGNCFFDRNPPEYKIGDLYYGELAKIELYYIFEKNLTQKYLLPYYFFYFKSDTNADQEKIFDVAIYPAVDIELFEK
jgi:hypothetical protein